MTTENQDNGEEQKKPEGQEGNEGNAEGGAPEGGMPDASDIPSPDASSIPPVEPVSVPEQPEAPAPAPTPEPIPEQPSSSAPDLSKSEEPAAPAPSSGPDLSKPAEPAAPQQPQAPQAPQAPNYGQQPNYNQPTAPQQPNYGGQQYNQYGQQNTLAPVPNGTAILVLGILSIVFCWCYGIVGAILGVIALAMSGSAARAIAANPGAYQPQSVSNFKTGKILAIIGIILSALVVLYVIFMFVLIGTSSYNYY